MAGLYGHVGEYVEGETDDKKVSVFLAIVGPKEYKLLSSLLAPVKPGEKSYAELVQVLQRHHSPEPSEILQRYRFHSRFRKPGESISVFVSELRALAQKCNFGDTLEDMLRDRLVCGVNNDAIQHCLLSETTKLTYKRAMELAQSLESAAKNVEELQGNKEKTTADGKEVHRMHSKGGHGPGGSKRKPQGRSQSDLSGKCCYRCGNDKHLAAKCPHIASVCHQCGKKGHLKAVCRSKRSD